MALTRQLLQYLRYNEMQGRKLNKVIPSYALPGLSFFDAETSFCVPLGLMQGLLLARKPLLDVRFLLLLLRLKLANFPRQ